MLKTPCRKLLLHFLGKGRKALSFEIFPNLRMAENIATALFSVSNNEAAKRKEDILRTDSGRVAGYQSKNFVEFGRFERSQRECEDAKRPVCSDASRIDCFDVWKTTLQFEPALKVAIKTWPQIVQVSESDRRAFSTIPKVFDVNPY